MNRQIVAAALLLMAVFAAGVYVGMVLCVC